MADEETIAGMPTASAASASVRGEALGGASASGRRSTASACRSMTDRPEGFSVLLGRRWSSRGLSALCCSSRASPDVIRGDADDELRPRRRRRGCRCLSFEGEGERARTTADDPRDRHRRTIREVRGGAIVRPVVGLRCACGRLRKFLNLNDMINFDQLRRPRAGVLFAFAVPVAGREYASCLSPTTSPCSSGPSPFENVSVKFGEGNRYGLIGPTGGQVHLHEDPGRVLEPTAGNVPSTAASAWPS